MGLTLEKLVAEMRPAFNDVCIVHDSLIGRLVGVQETEEDFYYIVRTMGRGQVLASAVGHCTSLKGHYPEKDYERLDNVLSLNNAERAEKFLVLPYVND